MAAVYWWSVGYGAIVVFVSPASTWTGTVCQGFVGMVLTLAVIFPWRCCAIQTDQVFVNLKVPDGLPCPCRPALAP